MSDELKVQAKGAFGHLSEAPTWPDGKTMKTSVCDAIEESVRRAAAIENELALAKVN